MTAFGLADMDEAADNLFIVFKPASSEERHGR